MCRLSVNTNAKQGCKKTFTTFKYYCVKETTYVNSGWIVTVILEITGKFK